MNYRRGFQRLVVVLGVCYGVIGGILLGVAWFSAASTQRFELARCLDAVRDPGESATRITVAECLEWHPPVYAWPGEWLYTIAFILFPALLYGFWRVMAWIGKGFLS